MDIFDLSKKLGRVPEKADGEPLSYMEQCAYIAGCLDVWFTLRHSGRATPEEIAKCMRMDNIEVERMYVLWLTSVVPEDDDE